MARDALSAMMTDKETAPAAPKPAAPSSPKADAMKDMAAAFKSGDFEAAALAFQRAYEACADHEDEDDAYPEV